jgi:putative ABC transport system permease protein
MLIRTLLSHYRRHPVQALFLLAGIIVANVLLVGTLLINAQARASYDRGEVLLRASPSGQVRHRDAGRSFDERVYVALRLQGFEMLAPVLRHVVRDADGEALEILGVDLFAMPGPAEAPDEGAPRSADSGLAAFAFPPYQLWAAPARIQQLGAVPGGRLTLESGVSLPPLVAAPGEQLGHRLLVDIGALQTLTERPGELTALLVFGATPDRLSALIAALPPDFDYFPYAQAPDPAELTRSFHLNLAAMGLLAFVVGVFLIYNALAFSYTDRRELVRKLRLSGVTRGELRSALTIELGLFLLLGGLLGSWLGAALAAWLLPGVGRTLAQLYGVYIAYPDGLVPSGFLLPLLMTAAAAALCMLFPLREALQAPLLERWQAGWQLAAAARRDRLMLLAGLVLLLAAALLGRYALTLWTALAGLAALLVGAVLCLPSVLRLLLGGLDRAVSRRRVRLAWLVADGRWLLGPAALALMALTLALVANSGLNTMIASFRQATDDWLAQRRTGGRRRGARHGSRWLRCSRTRAFCAACSCSSPWRRHHSALRRARVSWSANGPGGWTDGNPEIACPCARGNQTCPCLAFTRIMATHCRNGCSANHCFAGAGPNWRPRAAPSLVRRISIGPPSGWDCGRNTAWARTSWWIRPN